MFKNHSRLTTTIWATLAFAACFGLWHILPDSIRNEVEPVALAATLTVNTADDHNDGVCNAADCTLRADEKELGVCLADVGAGSTDLLVYHEGMATHSGAVPVGGDHFTNDVAVGLRTPLAEIVVVGLRAHRIGSAFYGYDVVLQVRDLAGQLVERIFRLFA